MPDRAFIWRGGTSLEALQRHQCPSSPRGTCVIPKEVLFWASALVGRRSRALLSVQSFMTGSPSPNKGATQAFFTLAFDWIILYKRLDRQITLAEQLQNNGTQPRSQLLSSFSVTTADFSTFCHHLHSRSNCGLKMRSSSWVLFTNSSRFEF